MKRTTNNSREMNSRSARRAALLASLCLPVCALPAMAQQVIDLAPVVVEGDPGVATEGTGSYTTDRVTVGGRQPQRVRDIPQTVTVVTRQELDDTGATSIEEASAYVPGLTNATGDGFVGSLYARGQEVFQFYVDGAPRPYLSIYGTAPDLFFFDRMEVMYGPSGVYQGSGEPVGTINLVRKRAPRQVQGEVAASVDTFGGYRGEIDVGAPLNESGTIRGRIAAFGDHNDGFVDFAEMESYGVYGTLEFDLTPDTTLSIGGILERDDTLRHSGLPTFEDGGLLDAPRDLFIGSTDNRARIPSGEVFAELEHGFDYGGVLKLSSRYFEKDASLRNLLSLTPVERATGNFAPFWFAREFDEETFYADANLTSPFALGGVPVELVVGADYRRDKQKTLQNFDFTPPPENIATFDPDAFPLPNIQFPGVGPGFAINSTADVEEYGLYAQVRAELFEGFKLNLGGRYSDYSSETDDLGRGTSSGIWETNFAPYAGVTYDVLENVTLYASYASIFQPQTALQVDGTNVQPRQGDQFEAGVKADFFDGMLSTQVSGYQITDRNRAEADLVNVGFFTGTEKADTKGFELLAAGSPIKGLELTAGYVHVDTELTNDPTPKHNFGAFAKYRIRGGMLEGLSIGGGVRAAGKFDNFDGPVRISAPGYVVFDGLLSYEVTENVTAQLNVYNLFDKKYVERVNETARGTFFGEPLNAQLTVRARF